MEKINFKTLSRKKKNLLGLLFIVIIAIIIWIIYISTNSNTTLKQDFHITDSDSISKVIISDKNNNKVVLEKQKDTIWLVNGKYIANMTLVNTIIGTFKDMRIREPLPKAARNNVIKDLATNGKKVEVYLTDYRINLFGLKLFKYQHLVKTYFVGGETPDEQGTFMLKKGDSQPFVVDIPNFRGYLSTRFSTQEDSWRSHIIMQYKQNEIAKVSISVPMDNKESFTLQNNGQGFSFIDYKGTQLNDFDTTKVVALLSCLVQLNYERVAKNISPIEKDTIFSKPPAFELNVTDQKGKVSTLKTFVKLSDPTSIAKDDKDFYQVFDINRCYAISSELKDTLVMQFFTLDNLLRPASYFYRTNMSLPYKK